MARGAFSVPRQLGTPGFSGGVALAYTMLLLLSERQGNGRVWTAFEFGWQGRVLGCRVEKFCHAIFYSVSAPPPLSSICFPETFLGRTAYKNLRQAGKKDIQEEGQMGCSMELELTVPVF